MSTTEDEEIGSIRDLIVYRDGIVAVIVGDFLGIGGEKKVTLYSDSVELARDADEGLW